MSIKLLAPEVSSQIAAGEVIERPASVVKELLENALDAGAGLVTVTIEGAGQRLIEVGDDGGGIPADELHLSVARHATSKLRHSEDLFQITTLGFRGEALASIASVSRLTITSRTADSPSGSRLRVEGGAASPVEAVGAPVGTLVKVDDLFFNVPARLKFLKQEPTERRQIDTLVTRYALAYPLVRMQLRQDGRPELQTSGNGNRREVLANLYGIDAARQMIEVNAVDEGVNVSGFISPAALTRSNRREILFFVNGRPVQDASLTAALLQAYHTLLMVGRFPIAVVFLEMPPESVDVNVHPTKAEVRFRDPSRLFAQVQRAVRRALLAHTPIPGLNTGLAWTPGEQPAPSLEQISSGRQSQGPLTPWPEDRGDASSGLPVTGITPPSSGAQTTRPLLNTPLLRLVGQIAAAYLVAEGPDGLYLIDQHAAHERVLFERFMAQQGGAHPGQALLTPIPVELPGASARLLEGQIPLLQHLGFQVEPFGVHTFIVRALPVLLAGGDAAAALRVVVEDFEEDETPLQAEAEARLVARVCKRAAVKAGQVLSAQEQEALLNDLQKCQSPRTCPHGRPTMIHISVDLLERQFGRRGPR